MPSTIDMSFSPLTGTGGGGQFYFGGDSFILHTSATSEVAGSVPEPSTWAMIIVGFFGVGFGAWRRRLTKPEWGMAFDQE